MNPVDKLNAVIGVLQDRILASDSALIPEKLFGPDRMETASLELAHGLLLDLMPLVEKAQETIWDEDA